MKIFLIMMLLAIASFIPVAWTMNIHYFGSVAVSPDFELNGRGENIDSIAFWEAPDLKETLILVTAKQNSLVEVWKYPFWENEQKPITHPSFDKSKVNGIVVDQEANLLYVAIAKPASTVSVFELPQQVFANSIKKKGWDLKSEPNLALLKLHNNLKKLYISADDKVYIHNAKTGHYLGEFNTIRDVETMVGDNFYQMLYIPDENDRTGVYAYDSEGSLFKKNGKNRFGREKVFQSDGEGILVYPITIDNRDTGDGFIVVADQRKHLTDFEFFDRKSWVHLGSLKIKGVSNTDGIASTQRFLPDYPKGLFVVINDDETIVCVGWEKILKAIGFIQE
jgi:myo-inositol-hexaphosphate 3-phosphohydrolase